MSVSLANAASFALLLTAVFAFRFGTWRRPKLLAGYFAFMMTLEGLADFFLLPPDALGIEIACVCLALSIPFIAATVWISRMEGAE